MKKRTKIICGVKFSLSELETILCITICANSCDINKLITKPLDDFIKWRGTFSNKINEHDICGLENALADLTTMEIRQEKLRVALKNLRLEILSIRSAAK